MASLLMTKQCKQRVLQHAFTRAADTFVPTDDLKHTQLSLVNQKRDRYHLPLLFNQKVNLRVNVVLSFMKQYFVKKFQSTLAGLEPAISGVGNRRVISFTAFETIF